MVKMQDDFKTIVELLSWTLSRVSLAPIPSLMLDLAVLLTYPIGLFKSYNPVVEYVVINNINYIVYVPSQVSLFKTACLVAVSVFFLRVMLSIGYNVGWGTPPASHYTLEKW
jgi:hypothetical protein